MAEKKPKITICPTALSMSMTRLSYSSHASSIYSSSAINTDWRRGSLDILQQSQQGCHENGETRVIRHLALNSKRRNVHLSTGPHVHLSLVYGRRSYRSNEADLLRFGRKLIGFAVVVHRTGFGCGHSAQSECVSQAIREFMISDPAFPDLLRLESKEIGDGYSPLDHERGIADIRFLSASRTDLARAPCGMSARSSIRAPPLKDSPISKRSSRGSGIGERLGIKAVLQAPATDAILSGPPDLVEGATRGEHRLVHVAPCPRIRRRVDALRGRPLWRGTRLTCALRGAHVEGSVITHHDDGARALHLHRGMRHRAARLGVGLRHNAGARRPHRTPRGLASRAAGPGTARAPASSSAPSGAPTLAPHFQQNESVSRTLAPHAEQNMTSPSPSWSSPSMIRKGRSRICKLSCRLCS